MPHAYSFKDVRVTFKSPYGDVRLGMADQGGGIGVADEGLSFEKAEERNTCTAPPLGSSGSGCSRPPRPTAS
jgi:hypothetical protein